MQTLLAVIDDLFQFARTSLFGVRPIQRYFESPAINGMQSLLALPHSDREKTVTQSFLSAQEHELPQSGFVYFIGIHGVKLHTDPVVAFDVVLSTIPYGQQVRMLKLGGRWAYIKWKDEEGWIFKDAIREQAREVFPMFESGRSYDAENEDTKKLRLCIHDAFAGGAASLALTDAEYVTYKLQQKELSLPWDRERPRTPGTWQKKLRGKDGVHIGIIPKTGSVMEYIVDDIGYVCYVEAVFPDQTIKVSAIGSAEEGVYSEEMIPLELWRELRPIFIEVL
jgi:hypothetical protein